MFVSLSLHTFLPVVGTDWTRFLPVSLFKHTEDIVIANKFAQVKLKYFNNLTLVYEFFFFTYQHTIVAALVLREGALAAAICLTNPS